MLKKILKSSLFRSSGIYTITSIASASIPFLLIPFLTRVFSPEDYGILSMAMIITNIVSPIIGLGANAAMHRKYFDTDVSVDFARYVGNVFILLFFSFLFFLAIFLSFGRFLSASTSVPPNWLLVILFIASFQFVTTILLTIWQVKVKPIKYGILQILQSFINIGSTFFFIYIINYGWESRLLGQLFAVLVTAIISVIYMAKLNYIKIQYSREYFKDILRFSLPLIPHTLGALLIGFTDRILITNLIGVTETGVYTVAFQIGSVLGLVNTAFNTAYLPWLYEKLNINDLQTKLKIVKFTYLYFISLIFVVLFSAYLLPFMLSILIGESFQSANEYIFWIILGYAFNGMYLMVSAFIFYVKKTKYLSFITVCTSVLNIPICYFFLRHFGTVGAGISMSVVYFILFIATWYLSNKVYQMPWLFPFRFIWNTRNI